MKSVIKKIDSIGFLIQVVIFRVKRNVYKFRECRGNVNKRTYSKDITFSHVTYYAGGNAGDIALSQCIRRIFEKNFLKINWKIVNVRDKVTEKTINDLNSTKAVVLGGGGLFLPDSNANVISGWQWAISTEQLDAIQTPIIVYSVGYNYFKGQENSELFIKSVTKLCEKAKFVGLRNYGSVNKVKQLLPLELQNKIVYQPCTTTLIRKIYGNRLPVKEFSKEVAFNIAFDREERRFGTKKKEILSGIAKAAKIIEDRGYKIVLVYHVGHDKWIKPYMDAEGVHYKEKNLTTAFPDEIYKFYNRMDLVLGMRGHAQMIPFGLNCEIISLVSHDKMRWFLEDIDALDWQVDLGANVENLTAEIVRKFIKIHETDSEITQSRLIEAQEKLWKLTKDNLEIIRRIIEA